MLITNISLNFTIRTSWTWRGLKTIHLPFLRESVRCTVCSSPNVTYIKIVWISLGYELILRTKSNLINKLVHQLNKCRFGVIQNLVFKKERNDHTRNINSTERGIVDVLRLHENNPLADHLPHPHPHPHPHPRPLCYPHSRFSNAAADRNNFHFTSQPSNTKFKRE